MSEVQTGVRHAVEKLFARFPKAEVIKELQRVVKRETVPAAAPAKEPEAALAEEPEAEEGAEAEPPPETPHKRSTGRKK